MKNKYLLMLPVFILIASWTHIGCTKEEKNPVGSTGIGNAILMGEIQPATFEKKNYNVVDEDYDGIRIEIVGTTLSTLTDIHGKWKINGIDAGTYSVRFTKPGFDTLQLDNIVVKSQDSLWLRQTVQDSTGTRSQTLDVLFLAEIPSKLDYISGTSTIHQIIKDRRDSHDTTHVIGHDTSYVFQAGFNVQHTSLLPYTESYLPIYYMYCISNQPTLNATEIPSSFYPISTWQKEPTGFVKVDEKEGIAHARNRNYTVNDDNSPNSSSLNITEYATKRGINMQYGTSLYLHVVFVWEGMKRVINQDKQAVWTVTEPVYYYTPFRTIPIQWK